ncbi:HNH endonuclease signature motif containing protein [Rhodococcus sp. NPDC019627]|uniref:HNH endonuclease signature motif containing protein n=1 Tax=unclassified Rhodococcus (in: high G+C Gram-positive bacteria) TaxID=192944 RepID=UPI0033DCCCE2
MKTCNRCKQEKPFEEFGKLTHAPDGLQYTCRGCRRSRQRAYYAANREAFAAKGKVRYQENKEKILAVNKVWRDANPDKCREYSRRHYEENKDSILDYQRRWADANRDKRRLYVKRYDEKHRAQHRAYMAVRNGQITHSRVAKISPERIASRMTYFGNKCWMCGGPFEHVDHVKPISKGGPHMLSNIRPACAPCNIKKGAKWPYETRSQNHRLRNFAFLQRAAMGDPER